MVNSNQARPIQKPANTSLGKLFAGVATLEERAMILGSTFAEKLIFKDGVVRTACPDSAISELIKPGKDFRGNKKGSAKIFALPSGQVEVTGIEPVSKHDVRKLSTCLLLHWLSGRYRGSTNQYLP